MKTLGKKWGVLIPARNEEKRISRLLQSLLDQDIPPLIIVVVNDGSSDRTGEIVKNFQRVHLVNLPDRGFNAVGTPHMAKTFNAGFKILSNHDLDYVFVSGGDSRYPPSYVSDLIEEMERNPRLMLVSGVPKMAAKVKRMHVDGSGRMIRAVFFEKIMNFQYPVNHSWESEIIFRTWMLGLDAYSLPSVTFSTRKGGVFFKSFTGWGRGMRGMGYWTPYVFARAVFFIPKHGFRAAVQLIAGYLSSDVIHSSKELKNFVRKFQARNLFKLIK